MSAARVSPERQERQAGSMAHHLDAMYRDLGDLCAIPSVRGKAAVNAPYGVETQRALNFFLERGKQLGFRAVNLDNRAGYVEFGQGEHLVAALCHLDVVPAGDGWDSDPFSPIIGPDRIIARGTADDKGPAIAVLYAMKDLLDSNFSPKGRIRLIVGKEEENGSSCMAQNVKVAEKPHAGFTPDASFTVIYAEKGICQLRLSWQGGQDAKDALRLVAAGGGEAANMMPGRCGLSLVSSDGCKTSETVTGKPGHASMPWLGENAISKAMLTAARKLEAAGCSHPFVCFYVSAIGSGWLGDGLGIACQDESGSLTCNSGKLSLQENNAELILDIRYPVHQTLEAILAGIRQQTAAYGIDVAVVHAIEPLYLPRDSFLVETLSRVYADLTGLDPAPVASGGGTYARTMPNVVAFGGTFPDEPETAHQAGEYLMPQHLLATAAIYREALQALAQPDPHA